MALATPRPALKLVVPAPEQKTAPARRRQTPEGAWTDRAFAPAEVLVGATLENSAADLGWLAWVDDQEPVVVRRDATSPVESTAVGDFPEPPGQPTIVDAGSVHGPWGRWCRSRGIRSCVVVPVLARGRAVGTMGLASATAKTLGGGDLRQLGLVSSLAVHARTYEARLAGQRRLFAEVSPGLENALAFDRAIRQPLTYREIAGAVGDSLDATYCLIAIHDSKGVLTLRAAAGHRPPRRMGVTSWPVRKLAGCARALRERRAVVLMFDRQSPDAATERRVLFSPTTQVGIILPFFAGPRTQGLLIIGEERGARRQPLSPERIAILELVASRVAHILRIARKLECERLAEQRRQRQVTMERERLAREVHDGVGQALSALLVQVRSAMTEGHAGPDDLQVLEHTARRAVDDARALAYGIRRLDGSVGTLEEARGYAETMLRSVRCRLSWTEERTDLKVAGRVLREIVHVVKESITNVVRHANANLVRVRVEYPDGWIRVTIRDDGVGFSPNDVRPAGDGRGLGLVESAQRLGRVGGTFDVRSTPNGGTVVLIEARRA
jgi:signal transduction histidine kinase